MTQLVEGVASDEARATHEPSPQAVLAVPVSVPNATGDTSLLGVMLDLFENPAFHVAIGGNPVMVEELMARARQAIEDARSPLADGLELAAQWHDTRCWTPDVFEQELHETSAAALRYLAKNPNATALQALEAAQGMSAGTAETLQAAQGVARQPGPKDAPESATP